jgi:hypothetical protein
MFVVSDVANSKPERVLCFMRYFRNVFIVIMEELWCVLFRWKCSLGGGGKVA